MTRVDNGFQSGDVREDNLESPAALSANFSDRIGIREVSAVFRSYETLEDAVETLLLAGIDRGDIDMIDDIATLERQLGDVSARAEKLADIIAAPRRPFLDKADTGVTLSMVAGVSTFFCAAAAARYVIASGGNSWDAAGVAMLSGFFGGGICTWLAYRWLKARLQWELDRRIVDMRIVICVRVRSPEKEAAAVKILKEHGAEAVHAHEYEN
jgi:hypothetical protein